MLAANRPFMQYGKGKDLHASIGTSFSARSIMSEHSSMGDGAQNSPRNGRVFFSFSHDEDRPRAEVIYKRWGERHPDGVPGFVDSRISNEARAGSEEDVKRAIRAGVDQATVTCVLIGAHTWQDRWVRYEIARSVERGNGLFAVRISGIADPSTHQKTAAGWNPLAYVGVGKLKDGDYLLYENMNGDQVSGPRAGVGKAAIPAGHEHRLCAASLGGTARIRLRRAERQRKSCRLDRAGCRKGRKVSVRDRECRTARYGFTIANDALMSALQLVF